MFDKNAPPFYPTHVAINKNALDKWFSKSYNLSFVPLSHGGKSLVQPSPFTITSFCCCRFRHWRQISLLFCMNEALLIAFNSLGKLVRKTFCFAFMWVTNKEREKANKKTSRIIQISWAAGVCLFWELKTFLWLQCAAFIKIYINRLSGNFLEDKVRNSSSWQWKAVENFQWEQKVLKFFHWKKGFDKNSFHWILMK